MIYKIWMFTLLNYNADRLQSTCWVNQKYDIDFEKKMQIQLVLLLTANFNSKFSYFKIQLFFFILWIFFNKFMYNKTPKEQYSVNSPDNDTIWIKVKENVHTLTDCWSSRCTFLVVANIYYPQFTSEKGSWHVVLGGGGV